jgi:catechol 2,3-dioxygenase-like lactoylglutathione lyase family enzyme
MGFKTLREPVEVGGEGSNYETTVGIPRARVKLTTLLFHDTYFLQLDQFLEPIGKQTLDLRPCDVGYYHISFVVDDVMKTYEELKAKGVHFLSPPVTNTIGQLACYFFDPDGIQLAITSAPRKVGG